MKMTPFFVAWKLWKVGLLSLCCATVQAKERRCSGLLSWEAQRREYSSGRFSQLFKVKTPPLPSSAIEKWFCSSPALILGKFLYVTWQREEPPAEQHSVCFNHSGSFIIGSGVLQKLQPAKIYIYWLCSLQKFSSNNPKNQIRQTRFFKLGISKFKYW